MLPIIRSLRTIAAATALLLALALLGTQTVFAAGIVGNGTPSSCTETAFDNALAGGGTVKFNCGSAVKTIVLTFTKQISATTIIDGGNKIILQAKNTYHFQVFNAQALTLKNITLTRGKSSGVGSIENFGTLITNHVTFDHNHATSGDGGAIHNYGTAKIKKSTFTKNKADGTAGGGAIYNDGGTLTVSKSTFSDNTATVTNEYGGAIYNFAGTTTISGSTFKNNLAFNGGALGNNDTMIVGSSTFTGNNASNGGGAIMNLNNSMTLTTSTISGNTASYGGGLVSYGNQFDLSRSTLSGNTSSSDGGGLYISGAGNLENVTLNGNTVTGQGHGGGGLFQHYGNVTLNFVTVADNKAAFGGGIYKDGLVTGSQTLVNTVLSNNTGGNCDGVQISNGHNLSSDTNCGSVLTDPTDKNHKNAKLGPLANNGGPTMTRLPQAGSPLINHGTSFGGVTVDQRGFTRPAKGGFDIGAVEVQ